MFDDTLDVFDGVQQHILTLGKALRERGHHVEYLVGQTAHPPVGGVHSMSRNMMVSFNGNRMRIPLLAPVRGIRKVLDEGRFDVLHVQAPYSPLMAGRVIKRADPGTGLVATYHIAPTGTMQLKGGQVLGRINAGSHRRIDRVISVSKVAADYARTTAGVESRIIPNPIDVAAIRANRERAGTESIDRLHGQGPHLVFLGRFVERKGADLLIEAIAQGEHRGMLPEGLHLTMAGKGPLLERCRQRAQGLTTPIDFPGFVTESDKPALLASANLAVFPSTGGESFGIVLLEAMASGAGVILAGDNPGYRSTLQEDDEALVRVNDPQTPIILAERIARVFGNPDWARGIHERQSALLNRYDVHSVADQVEEVYEQAIQDRLIM
nr:glycosyltransferase family 4 protein [Bifidobacterium indicum]